MPIDTEDFGAVLVRMGDRTRGAFTASQVNVGCKNRLQMEIYGTKGGVEPGAAGRVVDRASELQPDHHQGPSVARGGSAYADLPGGHSEGYDDTLKQCFRRFYAAVADPAVDARVPAVRRRAAATYDP